MFGAMISAPEKFLISWRSLSDLWDGPPVSVPDGVTCPDPDGFAPLLQAVAGPPHPALDVDCALAFCDALRVPADQVKIGSGDGNRTVYTFISFPG